MIESPVHFSEATRKPERTVPASHTLTQGPRPEPADRGKVSRLTEQ